MEIQSVSGNTSQAQFAEQAAVQVQAMGLKAMREQSDALAKLLASARIITDPNLGQSQFRVWREKTSFLSINFHIILNLIDTHEYLRRNAWK